MATKQEIFDDVVVGMKKQCGFAHDGPSSHASCYYYQESTKRRCSVGLLMSVEEAMNIQHKFGGCGISSLIRDMKSEGMKLPSWYNSKHLNFLEDLQDAHDSSSDLAEWCEKMRSIGKKSRIDLTELKKAEKVLLAS